MDRAGQCRRAMACEFKILATGENRATLTDILQLALDEVEKLDQKLNCFSPTSEVSYLNSEAARRPIIVGFDLFNILSIAKQVYSDTQGAFDITAGPLVDLWRKAEKTGVEPELDAIKTALQNVGMSRIILDDATHAVQFESEGIQINLGAIGKGYAVSKAASILSDYGVKSALISGGGSTIQAIGDGPDGDGWNIGIRHPSKFDERVDEITLRNQAMSTSGGPAQRDPNVTEHFEHIVDPITGMQAHAAAASVSVITRDATLSDALATAFYLRGSKLSDVYCANNADVRTVFVPIA